VNMDGVGTIDPRIPVASPQIKKSPVSAHLSPNSFSSPQPDLENLDHYMDISNDLLGAEPSYSDMLVWPDYSVEMDMYSSPLQLGGPQDGMPMPPQFATTPTTNPSEIASTTEPLARNPSSRASIHTRATSIMSSNEVDYSMKPTDQVLRKLSGSSIPEFEVVLVSEGAWPLARCNPPIYSGSCPRTAIVHLECFEQKSKQDGTWDALEQVLTTFQDSPDVPQVVPFTSRSRDKMLAITQSFLHKALDIHRSGIYPKTGHHTAGQDFNFIVLPPSSVLEYFLRSYVQSLSIYYPLVARGIVDPNEMLHNTQASTLLVLLMIAQGAAAVPTAEARYLSAGLTETCRISLFDIIEKNIELSADPTALRCALLFTLLGAWGGDKWQMDIAMGQRGMYLAVSNQYPWQPAKLIRFRTLWLIRFSCVQMLKHAGMLEPQPSMIPILNDPKSIVPQWHTWTRRESQNRFVSRDPVRLRDQSLIVNCQTCLQLGHG